MCRLTDLMVRSTLVTAGFLAGWPTSTSPFFANATTDGVVREPSELAITVGSPPSRTATTELVVPRSMPTARAMKVPPDVQYLVSRLGGARSPVWSGIGLEPSALHLSAGTTGGPAAVFPGSCQVAAGTAQRRVAD